MTVSPSRARRPRALRRDCAARWSGACRRSCRRESRDRASCWCSPLLHDRRRSSSGPTRAAVDAGAADAARQPRPRAAARCRGSSCFMLMLVVIADRRQTDISSATVAGVLRAVRRRLHHPADVVPADPPRRRRHPGRVDAGRPARPDPEPGRDPDLPAGWHLESALRSAGGTPFAGDFIVDRRAPSDRLDVVVVDVSGKGEGAGTRALLLSGAFGGLLGALPPGEFLPAANDYLLRQNWDEGFATAVHLSLDLATGEFAVRTAGHPPAVQLHAGSGRWTVHSTEGPALGLIEGTEFPQRAGHPAPRRRDHALHRRPGRDPEPRHRARHRPDARRRPSSCCAVSSRAAPRG